METKENEICYSEIRKNTICFYDLKEKKIKSSLSNISKIIYGIICYDKKGFITYSWRK